MSTIHRRGTQAHYFASGFLIFGAYKTADHPWLTKLVAPPFCVYLSHLGLRWASPDFTYEKPELYRGLNPLNSSWRSWILWMMMKMMTQPGWIIAEENGGMIWIWIVEISSRVVPVLQHYCTNVVTCSEPWRRWRLQTLFCSINFLLFFLNRPSWAIEVFSNPFYKDPFPLGLSSKCLRKSKQSTESHRISPGDFVYLREREWEGNGSYTKK